MKMTNTSIIGKETDMERYHTAYQKAVHDHVLPLMVADGFDSEQALAMLAGILTVKYNDFHNYMDAVTSDIAFSDDDSRPVARKAMIDDGISPGAADAFINAVEVSMGLEIWKDAAELRNSDDVVQAYAMGYLSNNTNPPTPEQAAELEKLKSKFSPQECQEICIEASRSMERLRTAKKLISQVKSSMMENGATTEAADAFIEGFMTGDGVSIQ